LSRDDVTITGPVVLSAMACFLGKMPSWMAASISSPWSYLKPGASVRHNAVLFAGGLTLEPEASIRDNAVLFAGGLTLKP